MEAEVALGNLYEAGSVLPQDPAQAAIWYRRAADKGHAGAQMNLAMMYFDGEGVPRDIVQAIAWYEKAAEHGESIASFSLGSIYESGADPSGETRPRRRRGIARPPGRAWAPRNIAWR